MSPYMNENINIYMISYVLPLFAEDGTSIGIVYEGTAENPSRKKTTRAAFSRDTFFIENPILPR